MTKRPHPRTARRAQKWKIAAYLPLQPQRVSAQHLPRQPNREARGAKRPRRRAPQIRSSCASSATSGRTGCSISPSTQRGTRARGTREATPLTKLLLTILAVGKNKILLKIHATISSLNSEVKIRRCDGIQILNKSQM